MALAPETVARVDGDPLGAFQVTLEYDRRPPVEHGVRKYPGRSYLGGNDTLEPTAVVLLRLLAQGLVQSGVATHAGLLHQDGAYVLEVTVDHLGVSYNDGLETLAVPILPTSAVHAVCDVKLVLRDSLGRIFLDQSFRSEKRAMAALITGLRGKAASELADAMSAVCDQAMPALHRSVEEFWKRVRRGAGKLD